MFYWDMPLSLIRTSVQYR